MSRNAERLKQLFVDLERIDFDAVVAHCAEDCVYEDVPYAAATVVGRDCTLPSARMPTAQT